MTRRLMMLALALTVAAAAGMSGQSRQMPTFQPDTSWPKLPNNWVLGQTPSVAVDRHDHVWILHRPRTVPEDEEAQRRAAGARVRRRRQVRQRVGRTGTGLRLARQRARHLVDYKDNVWIGGSSPTSHVADATDRTTCC